jgi:hypothetical protein
MDKPQDLLHDALNQPIPALAYYVTRRLKALYPGRAVIEGDACGFDLMEYADAGNCTLRLVRPDIMNQVTTGWEDAETGLRQRFRNVWYAVEWEAQTVEVLVMTYPRNDYTGAERQHYWVVADVQRVAERFYEAVRAWSSELREEVMVFEEGTWHKSRALFRAIRDTNPESLILGDGLRDEIFADVDRFLRGEAEYDRLGVAWKRGILLTGPPGNGKTHCVKAIINNFEIAPLYVKSFKDRRYQTEHDSIRRAFAQARKTTPCLLVLEDIDSLVTDDNRAYFLNELDGFAENRGILTVATTNHPERLDPAIVERPSRFDRKYHFDLPGLPERDAYLNLWNATLAEELRLPPDGIAEISETTAGFSFAMLKELCLAALLRLAGEPGTAFRDWQTILREQAAQLGKQLRPLPALPAPRG